MVIMTALSLMLLLFQFKRGIFAPSTVFGVIAGLNILVFYLVVVYSYFPDYLADWWQIKNLVNYKSTVNFVTLYYLSLLLISILINNLTSKNVKDKSKKKNFIDFNKIKIESVITRYFVSYSMVWLLFCINLLFILHFSQVDFNSLLHYNQYLLVRIPEKVNIHNEFIAFIHKIIPVIGIIIAPMVVLFYRRKVILLFILSIIPLIYCYLIVISFNSRFSSVYTFIIAIMIIITNKKRKINLPVILLVVLGMILYAASIKLR
ncbi:hypothetical protein, partial [Geobacillus thermodenitrificans]|uniref:hypothetical protein n=1 Tax=Geobacillus thermodenitrificans TaxID=33940 RepID=UPI002E1F43F1|nr:hypothetical protein [Geobacillus thermodenitrificans]